MNTEQVRHGYDYGRRRARCAGSARAAASRDHHAVPHGPADITLRPPHYASPARDSGGDAGPALGIFIFGSCDGTAAEPLNPAPPGGGLWDPSSSRKAACGTSRRGRCR
eukprot:5429712-Heterocapsa_arctica.AAC.1